MTGGPSKWFLVSTKKIKVQVLCLLCVLLLLTNSLLPPYRNIHYDQVIDPEVSSEVSTRPDFPVQSEIIPPPAPVTLPPPRRRAAPPPLLTVPVNRHDRTYPPEEGEGESDMTLRRFITQMNETIDLETVQDNVASDTLDPVEVKSEISTRTTIIEHEAVKPDSTLQPVYLSDSRPQPVHLSDSRPQPVHLSDGTQQPVYLSESKAVKLSPKKNPKDGGGWSLNNLISYKDDVLDIKPLVNYTANLLGLNTQLPPGDLDPNDPTNVMKSLFQIWNPKASNWALKASRSFKQYILESGEQGWNFTAPHLTRSVDVKMENCNCTRRLEARFPRAGTPLDSTCSQDSYMRGPGQRIIGFSFYGNPNSTKGKERKYYQGIKENLALVPLYYPGWTVRVYYDLEPGSPLQEDLCFLACSNPSLDICYVRRLPSSLDISKVFAMNWRFFPVLDPQVDLYVSRDLDSRLNSREAAAVKDWLASPHYFHFMRDHPAHSIEVLGSGWGVSLGIQNSTVRTRMMEAFKVASKDPMFWAPRKAYGPDQGFLKRYLWPWGKWSAKSHDSYTCHRFPRTSAFPTQRLVGENNFVASVVEARDVMRQECPVACRPKDYKDWKYC